ncbi:MAG: hypothetical protein OJJ54_03570 [Pseudonocardia sp.]|nr:hypothetical protein [Pseudonocardia sp.]
MVMALLLLAAGTACSHPHDDVAAPAGTSQDACGLLPDGCAASASPGTDRAAPRSSALEEFLHDCESRVGRWRAGQVNWPGSLRVTIGDTTTYSATLDVGDVPSPTDVSIPGPSPRSEPVYVQCAVAARLTPVGDALTVDEENWVVRSFTPLGKVDWTWAVTAAKAKDQPLKLEIQPAVQASNGVLQVSGENPEVASFTTDVVTDANILQETYQLISDNKSAAIGLGIAMLGMITFAGRAGQALRRAVATWRGRPGPSPSDEDEDEDQSAEAEAAGPRPAPGAKASV